MLVVQIDPVGSEPPQRTLNGGADIGGAAVPIPWALAGVRNEPEFGGQYHVVAAVLECPADEFLVDVGAVDLGGVDEVHPEVEGAVDGADGFVVVGAGSGVAVRHAHCAKADARYCQVAESCVLHV